MRKFFCVLLIFALLCVLPGCGERRVCALPDEGEARLLAKRPLTIPSAEESMEMARFMCSNRVCVSNDTLYTMDFDGDFQPVLAAYSRRGVELSVFRILVSDCVPEWLCLYEGCLYYVNSHANGRIECYDPAAGLYSVIADKPCSYLSIRDGRLYYCNEKGYFCSAGLDGSGETVIVDKRCCYPWLLGEALIYQDDNDGEKLRLRWLSDGAELTLSADAAYAPVLLGEKLIYSVKGGIHSMSIDGYDPAGYITPTLTGAAELIYEQGKWLLRGLSDDYGIDQWRVELSGGAVENCEAGLYRWCDYIDGSFRVDAVYYPDGRLRDFELVGADGSVTRYLSGKITKSR